MKKAISTLGKFLLSTVVATIVVSFPMRAAADDPGYYYYDDQYNRHDYRGPDFRDELASPYLIDPVNRRSSLTPEPVWRSMFRSIHERIAIEQRTFGVGGLSARELRYWQRGE